MLGIDYLNKSDPSNITILPIDVLEQHQRKLAAYSKSHPELTIVSKAVKRRWNIPPHMREQALAVIDDVMEAGSREEQVKAVNTLVAMDKSNLDEERMNKPIDININFAELSDTELKKHLKEIDPTVLAQLGMVTPRVPKVIDANE